MSDASSGCLLAERATRRVDGMVSSSCRGQRSITSQRWQRFEDASYRVRYRTPNLKEPTVAYVVEKRGVFYAVIYEGTTPVSGGERRRWLPAKEGTLAPSTYA